MISQVRVRTQDEEREAWAFVPSPYANLDGEVYKMRVSNSTSNDEMQRLANEKARQMRPRPARFA